MTKQEKAKLKIECLINTFGKESLNPIAVLNFYCKESGIKQVPKSWFKKEFQHLYKKY